MNIDNVKAYELVEQREVKDLYSVGYLLKHKKTGAKVFILENDDENKVFTIGFRTPPLDSTGAPHIMEHSVLCGSAKFPIKDPFVELAKGSLNTFLNAMTYPDKTVYPVASCNDRDFRNLVEVYMDAVFYPNIYDRPQIFKQEGWHYELESAEAPLVINGVVYNEMKGAFSSAEDMIDRKMYEALYPDTAYALESGGDPEVIPELTYEQFIAFHQKYYHPSNSFIYLYGDCDMEEQLNWLDNEYLGKYEYLEMDSTLKLQKGFDVMKNVEMDYSITEEESLEENTYLSYGSVIDTALNKELYLAFQIIEYALLESPGAALKERLIKEKLGKDVMSTYENGILQPYFSIMIKNAEASDADRFLNVLRDEFGRCVKEGIDKKALEAGINYYEFKYREADFGSYPKGLMYGLQSFDSWLYDESNPFMHISATDTISFLKEQINTGYFEKLIDKYFLNNTHSAVVVAKPVRGLTSKKDDALAQKLREYKASLSKEEIDALVEDTKALKKYQEEPSTPEEMLTLPQLEIKDLKREVSPFSNEEISEDGVKYLFHDIKTNGISYLTLLFDLDALPIELIPYASLAKSLIGLISTDNYHYSDITNEINRQCGGISLTFGNYNHVNGETYRRFLEIDAKFLVEKADFVFDMIYEMLFNSKFDSYDRILELLMMSKSRIQMAMMSAGHSIAVNRALSYFSPTAGFSDRVAGYDYYRFIVSLIDNFETDKEDISTKLAEAMGYILDRSRLLVDYTGSREDFEQIREYAHKFSLKLSNANHEKVSEKILCVQKNEGFKSASQVQYVAMAGDFTKSGQEYTGAMQVLKVIMSYDYLWINVRVKGGAYGCMNSFKRNGECYFVSYRDPNLSETFEVFKKAADYLEAFDPDERDMTKYVIGAIRDSDTPLTPKMKGDRALNIYLSGNTIERLQKIRNEVLSCDKKAINALGACVRDVISQNNICVIGAEDKIKENAQHFKTVENLV